MKIDIKEEKKIEELISYPCLRVHKSSELLVLFTSSTTGMSLRAGNVTIVGEYSAHWDIDEFKPFTGSIILQND